MNPILFQRKENCTGCGACENGCPVKAISMKEDPEGFWYPAVDESLCVSCGRCRRICPVFPENAKEKIKEQRQQGRVYAAWSLDKEIQYQSTSGGIFSELALYVLGKGGSLCGAVYDRRHQVKHFLTSQRQDLERLRQSKYAQSDMGENYREIARVLRGGGTLLFCGTPCQCAGVFCYCREMEISTENLYLIDFICRGSNSPKVFRKYLEELEERFRQKVARVWFKNKTYGWNHFCTKIEFENGGFYLQDRYEDAYIRGYIEENLYIRPSCGQCRFKGFERTADITLGDFWGVQTKGKEEESDQGTSMVMIHTEKGEELWKGIESRVFFQEKTLEEVEKGNVCFAHSIEHGVHREAFMENLDEMPVIQNIERFCNKKKDKV